MKYLYIFYKKIITVLATPVMVRYFFDKKIGRYYGFGIRKKLKLLRSVRRNVRNIESASDWQEHLKMISVILSIPPSIKGDLIECGTFRGASAASLSLAAAITGRRLIVADSFEGLPKPRENDQKHFSQLKIKHKTYEKGQYTGTLEEVQNNIRRFGAIKSCEFLKGFFDQTLPSIQKRRFVFIFLDVDLSSSLEDCLKNLWPLFEKNCLLFSHEAQDLPYISLFFNATWWQDNLGTYAPGFVGAGTGLPLGIAEGFSLGYTVKSDAN